MAGQMAGGCWSCGHDSTPHVLEAVGYDPEVYMWLSPPHGLGVERLAMVQHQIDDIRRLYSSDLLVLAAVLRNLTSPYLGLSPSSLDRLQRRAFYFPRLWFNAKVRYSFGLRASIPSGGVNRLLTLQSFLLQQLLKLSRFLWAQTPPAAAARKFCQVHIVFHLNCSIGLKSIGARRIYSLITGQFTSLGGS